MRYVIGLLSAAFVVLGIGVFATWERPKEDNYYGSPSPILPMAFAHADHRSVTCVDCHHNFTDGSGIGTCVHCHVTDEELFSQLENQFHDLCRGCHVELSSQHEASGPVRQCLQCHHLEDVP